MLKGDTLESMKRIICLLFLSALVAIAGPLASQTCKIVQFSTPNVQCVWIVNQPGWVGKLFGKKQITQITANLVSAYTPSTGAINSTQPVIIKPDPGQPSRFSLSTGINSVVPIQKAIFSATIGGTVYPVTIQ